MLALPDKYMFTIGEKLKTTKQGKHLEPVELVAYKHDGFPHNTLSPYDKGAQGTELSTSHKLYQTTQSGLQLHNR